jgi:hypothetical protein
MGKRKRGTCVLQQTNHASYVNTHCSAPRENMHAVTMRARARKMDTFLTRSQQRSESVNDIMRASTGPACYQKLLLRYPGRMRCGMRAAATAAAATAAAATAAAATAAAATAAIVATAATATAATTTSATATATAATAAAVAVTALVTTAAAVQVHV